MNGENNRWWLAIPFALGVLILNVLIHVLYMVVYGYFINPGNSAAFYQEYAQASAPYSSIIAGIPLMFLAGRWIGTKFSKGNSVLAAVLMWLIYFLIDFTIVLVVGALAQIAMLFAISFATKLAAAYLGGLSAKNRGAYLTR